MEKQISKLIKKSLKKTVYVANVGSENAVKTIEAAFGARNCSYFYNSKQIFQKDLSYINQFN